MIKFTITSTKGGVGKTTLTANLGALLADMGLRVLLIDADVQPSLSKYFPLATSRPAVGLTDVIVRGQVIATNITPTVIPNLHIVVSDDPEGHLPIWLQSRIDRGFRLRFALQLPIVAANYDCVLIDTPGAIGPLQDAALMAADILVSPITPEILSAREFKDGTMELLERLEPGSALGATLGPVKAVIYRQDRSADARLIASGIREDFIRLKGRVSVLQTVVPHAKAYKEAATLRVPVHRHERRRHGVMPSASVVMHQLAWELIPSLQGVHADAPPLNEAVEVAAKEMANQAADEVAP
jgi:chromosome partitioning related protein ParA